PSAARTSSPRALSAPNRPASPDAAQPPDSPVLPPSEGGATHAVPSHTYPGAQSSVVEHFSTHFPARHRMTPQGVTVPLTSTTPRPSSVQVSAAGSHLPALLQAKPVAQSALVVHAVLQRTAPSHAKPAQLCGTPALHAPDASQVPIDCVPSLQAA